MPSAAALKTRPLPPHLPGAGEKVWYVRSPSLEHKKGYMRALLDSDRLFEAGAVEIHHGQAKKYYTDILSGKSVGALAQGVLTDGCSRGLRLKLDIDPEHCDQELPARHALRDAPASEVGVAPPVVGPTAGAKASIIRTSCQ